MLPLDDGKKITPYKDSELNKKARSEQMFDNISGGYDGLNRVISLGADTRWRKKVINLVLDHDPQSILDIATGTGDLAISFAQHTQTVKSLGWTSQKECCPSLGRKWMEALERSDRIRQRSTARPYHFRIIDFKAITVSLPGISRTWRKDCQRSFAYWLQGDIRHPGRPQYRHASLETGLPCLFPEEYCRWWESSSQGTIRPMAT